jgi:hypothetical protein
MEKSSSYAAFAGDRLIASGDAHRVILRAKQAHDAGNEDPLLVFDESTGQQIEFDLRGSPEEVLARELPAELGPAGPGRPKLGVVSREVSLLPRHWDWLEQEPNGISAALRRLVEEASKRDPEQQRQRKMRAAVSRIMSALAGNRPHYEEALRALFAGEQERFEEEIRGWPKDLRKLLVQLTRGKSAE